MYVNELKQSILRVLSNRSLSNTQFNYFSVMASELSSYLERPSKIDIKIAIKQLHEEGTIVLRDYYLIDDRDDKLYDYTFDILKN